MGKIKTIGRRDLLAGGAALAALPMLGACTSLVPGQRPAPDAYRLTPKSTFSEDLPTVNWQLVVELPVANASLATTRIALNRTPIRVEYFARASWTDRAPQMVQTLIVESFENSNRIVSIGRESLGLRSDFVLKSELREFQAEYRRPDGEMAGEAGGQGSGVPPKTRVALAAKLVQMPQREIVASETFESVTDSAADNLPDIIAAFDESLGRVLKGLVEWSLENGEAFYQLRRSS